MPTNRIPLVRRPVTDPTELFGPLLAVLLTGWAAHEATQDLDADDDDDPFRIFLYHDRELELAWLANRDVVIAEARRRGIVPCWAEERFEIARPSFLPPLDDGGTAA